MSASRISDMTPLPALPASGAFVPVVKTGDGTNYAYDLTKGLGVEALFINASTLSISTSNFFQSSGYSILDVGSAVYVYDAAVDAAYVAANPRASFLELGGRGFKLSTEQQISSLMFGVKAGSSSLAAANTTAYNAALAWLATLSPGTFGYATGGSQLYTPTGHYYFNGSLSPESAVDNFGDSTGWGNGTIFEWTSKTCHGFNLLGWDGTSRHASGSKVHGFHLIGARANPLTDRGNYHGVYVNCPAQVYDIFGEKWPGKLVYAFADASVTNGNVNGSRFRNLFGQYCDWTLYLDANDANGCVSDNIRGTANLFGTYFDRGFLGSTLTGGISENNNVDANFLSKCHVSGHIYVVAYGQEAWCSTNAPTGAKTSNTGWLYYQEGSAGTLQPTWTTGQTWYFSAPYAMHPGDGSIRGAIYGVYIEDSENPPVIGPRCTFLPAANTRPVWLIDGTLAGGTMHGDGTTMEFPGGLTVDGIITALGNNHYLGTSSGIITDVNINLNTTDQLTLLFNRYDAAGSLLATDGYILSAFGTIYWNAVSGHHVRIAGSDILNFSSSGADLQTGKVLSVAGTQVVAARQTGTPADATDLATALTLLNALKAKLITHGLIS